MTASLPRDDQSPNLSIFDLKTLDDNENTSLIKSREYKDETKHSYDGESESKQKIMATATGKEKTNSTSSSLSTSEDRLYQSDTSDGDNNSDNKSQDRVQKKRKERVKTIDCITMACLSTSSSPSQGKANSTDSKKPKTMKRKDVDRKKASKDEESDTTASAVIVMADDLGPYDILCGRDKDSFNYIGNRRFRVSLDLAIPEYLAAKTKSQKATFIVSMVRKLKNEVGVRFLQKRQSEPGSASTDSQYVELNDNQARKKVGHAIRDMAVARQQLILKRSLGAKQSPTDGETTIKQSPSETRMDAVVHSHDDDDDSGSDLDDSLSSMLPHILSDLDESNNDTDMEPLPAFVASSQHQVVHHQQAQVLLHQPQPLNFSQQHHPPQLLSQEQLIIPDRVLSSYEQFVLEQRQNHQHEHQQQQQQQQQHDQEQERNDAAAYNYYYYHYHHHHHFHHSNNNINIVNTVNNNNNNNKQNNASGLGPQREAHGSAFYWYDPNHNHQFHPPR